MQNKYILILLAFFFQLSVSSQTNFDECTIGVAHGSVTQDGRPLVWKTRDYDSNHMGLKNLNSYDYNYIYIYDDSWTLFPTSGLNEHGLALVKADILDLTPATTGPANAQLQRHTLGYCRTIDEFQI